MKFYHLADIHLGAVPDRGMPWSKVREREIYESFYNVLDRAKMDAVDFVFISGDLFHRQPLKRELKVINYHFGKIAPVQIIIIAGNHDYIKPDSNYVNFTWSDNVHFITDSQCRSIYFEEQNTCVYGFSYHKYEITENPYDTLKPQSGADWQGGACTVTGDTVKLPAVGARVSQKQQGGPGGARVPLPPDCTHILLAHGGDEKHIPIRWQTLDGAGFDYVALGHIHRPQIFKSRKMAYSGALEPIDKNDDGPHGYIEGICQSHQTRIRFVPWAKRCYINISVPVEPHMTWEEIKDRISQRMAEERQTLAVGYNQEHQSLGIYKVSLEGYKDVDLVYDVQDIYGLGDVISVDDRLEYDFDFDSLYEANKGNLLGCFIEKVQAMTMDEQKRKKVLYYGFNALYKTGERQ